MKNKARNLIPSFRIFFAILIASLILFLNFIFTVKAEAQEVSPLSNATLKNLRWRLLGPAYFGGRISDIAVPRGQKYTVYCAAASGGIWKTVNNGTTWEPIFDNQGTGSIGCIAISSKNPNIIWAGTGEPIAASHSTWGDGVYKSIDAGKTWTHMGLKDSHQIGKIIIDPEDLNIVYVAAVGHLWGANSERGLYKTTDGGKTWNKSLFISDKLGVVDIAMDPLDNKTLYAATYGRMRSRYAKGGVEILEGGGIYKTADAGKTWNPLKEGLPIGRVGKIGLDISLTNPNKIYAILEREPFRVRLAEGELQKIRDLIASDKEPDPKEAKRIRELIEKLAPTSEKAAAVVDGLSRNEQTELRLAIGQGELDTGGGVFRSINKGVAWVRMNKFPTGASYYSKIYAHPKNEDGVYVPETRMWTSIDGGKTFEQTDWAFSSWMTGSYIHGDFHPFWIDPSDANHLIAGTDGGLYSSHDGGENWEAHPMPIGQFYTIAVDMRNPYYVYGGLQDNGGWAGPSATRHMSGITDNDWFKYETSDGGYVRVDPTDNMTVYTEIQNGGIRRLDLRTGAWTRIQPRAEKGESPLRFNFIAPFILSSHDPYTLYMGAQRILKTMDKGNNWKSISPDLTKGDKDAIITTVAESPLVHGLLFVGTEDGNLYITQNDGETWTNVVNSVLGLPRDKKGQSNIYVSRLEASHFNPSTAYVSFDGHRDDDFRVYIFRTTDYGKTWASIKGDLPDGFPVQVIREDFKNPNLLFVGTSIGAHVSVDGGVHWEALKNGLPPVPVADMIIHPRESDLAIGTYGRGIYVMDISPLQELTHQVMNSDMYLFNMKPATLFYLDTTKNKGASGDRRFFVPNPFYEVFDLEASRYFLGQGSELAPPGAAIYYYIQKEMTGPVKITILDHRGELVLREFTGESHAGINRVLWDLREKSIPPPPKWRGAGGNDAVRLRDRGRIERPGPLVSPGQYLVRLSVGGKIIERTLVINRDKFLQF
jgi:photosystem II stability/assembly factor-like uncharacterized protein